MLEAIFLLVSVAAFLLQRDEISGSLLLFQIAGSALLFLSGVRFPEIAAVLACIEALFVLGMVSVVTARRAKKDYTWGVRSRRAQTIGLLSLGKITLMFSYLASYKTGALWVLYASGFNALFVLQAITAGGGFDVILAFVNDLHDRFRSRFARRSNVKGLR